MIFPNHELGKGQFALYPIKLSRFDEKKIKFIRNNKIPKHWVKRLSTSKYFKSQKESSWHPNFIDPFECGKSFHNKSFPKRIGTLTPPKLKIIRGGTMMLK